MVLWEIISDLIAFWGAWSYILGAVVAASVLWALGVREPFILTALALFVGGPCGVLVTHGWRRKSKR